MIELKEDNLQEILQSGKPTVVQYGATWCGNCRLVKPKFSKLADSHEEVQFVYVDAEKFPQSRGLAQVTNLPTFAAFSGSELVEQTQGNRIELVEELVSKVQGGAQ